MNIAEETSSRRRRLLTRSATPRTEYLPEPDVLLEHKAVTSHRSLAHREQGRLLKDQDIFHETIRAKLEGLYETAQFANYSRCGHEQIYRTCRDCGAWEAFEYHCNIRWCPRCNWKIATRRREVLHEWLKQIPQPKHLVTTQRNSQVFTARQLRLHQVNLARLRRQDVFKQVTGGCVSIEVTNEGRGWHLHAHWLVNARWVDAVQLSQAWGRLVGQEYAIVKVLDVRNRSNFERELSKYCVKGNELAKWPGDEIHQFVRAVKGRRFFFVFGELFKLQAKIRAALNERKPRVMCDCGCNRFIFEDERSSIAREHRRTR